MRFLGFCNQSQLPSVYRAADVLALPSEGSETWGLVVNEAMACGTPCVVSDACGCAPDMIAPSINGAVFKVGSVHSLASNLLTVLQIDRDSVEIFKHSEDYSVSVTASGILSAINSLRN
jgi:glycosyltransferase involved in cell wall biosynthesis